MSTEAKVWSTLKGENPFSVTCRHNFWGGSYYELGGRPIYVLAVSADEARQFIKDNLELAETYFRSRWIMRGSKRIRLIRLSETYKMHPRDVAGARPALGVISIKALNRNGEWVTYNA